MKAVLALAIATVALAPAAAAAPQARLVTVASARTPLLLFVIDGQSNAEGYGVLETHQTPNPLVLDMLHPDGPRPAVDPLYVFGGSRTEGSGFGRFFGNYLVRHARVRVGLIDCGRGGYPLASLMPGQQAYTTCLEYVHIVEHRNPSARLAGVLWSQGETDAEQQQTASTWAPRFEQLVTALRRDLHSPTLPVVMQRTLDFQHLPGALLPYTTILRDQQQQAASALAHVTLVSADGLPHKGEHFTPAGYSVLGARMAQAWLALATF